MLLILVITPGAGSGSESSRLFSEVGFLGLEVWPESLPSAIDFDNSGAGSGSESSRQLSEVGVSGLGEWRGPKVVRKLLLFVFPEPDRALRAPGCLRRSDF